MIIERWLKPAEILDILLYPSKYNEIIHQQLPAVPPRSGSIFLIHLEGRKKIRQDGYEWQKLKDGLVRESCKKLKVNSQEKIRCYYAKTKDMKISKRTSFVIDGSLSYFLIQYLRLDNPNTNVSQVLLRPRQSELVYTESYQSGPYHKQNAPLIQNNHFQESIMNQPTQTNQTSEIPPAMDSSLMNEENNFTNFDHNAYEQSIFNFNNFEDPSTSLIENDTIMKDDDDDNLNQEHNGDFLPDGNLFQQNELFSHNVQPQNYTPKILEFCPTTFTSGQSTKILVIIDETSLSPFQNHTIELVFANIHTVPTERVTKGVYRCYYSPSHLLLSPFECPVFVRIDKIHQSQNINVLIVHPQQPIQNEMKMPNSNVLERNELKDRLKNHLSIIHTKLNIPIPENVETLSLEQYFMNVLFACLHHPDSSTAHHLLCVETDEDGFTLVHYASALRFVDCVNLLLNLKVKFAELEQSDRYQALLTIQRNVRAWLDRRKFLKKKKALEIIQRTGRGYIARKQVSAMREKLTNSVNSKSERFNT